MESQMTISADTQLLTFSSRFSSWIKCLSCTVASCTKRLLPSTGGESGDSGLLKHYGNIFLVLEECYMYATLWISVKLYRRGVFNAFWHSFTGQSSSLYANACHLVQIMYSLCGTYGFVPDPLCSGVEEMNRMTTLKYFLQGKSKSQQPKDINHVVYVSKTNSLTLLLN